MPGYRAKNSVTGRKRRNSKMTDKENKTRRLLKANFKKPDEWYTLKYPKGTKKCKRGKS